MGGENGHISKLDRNSPAKHHRAWVATPEVKVVDVSLEKKNVHLTLNDGKDLADKKITELILSAGYNIETIKRTPCAAGPIDRRALFRVGYHPDGSREWTERFLSDPGIRGLKFLSSPLIEVVSVTACQRSSRF